MFRDYRPIEGYEDYIVSNYGEVFSNKGKSCRMLKPASDGSGYLMVVLCQGGSRRTLKVHVLVGNAFIGKRTGEMTFDHIDRNSVNNRADNIRLATKQQQNLNRNSKRGKSGEKYINIVFSCAKPYYRFHVVRTINGEKKSLIKKYFSFKKYCIDDALKFRDDFIKNNPQLDINLL